MPPKRATPDSSQMMFEPIIYTPTVIARQPDGSIIARAGKPILLNGDDEIGTIEAAKIIGCDQNSIYRYIDDGLLVQGTDWRQIADGRKYYIKRAAILRLSGRMDDGADSSVKNK